MLHAVNGIHHITTLASDTQRNVDFYVKMLGLRLVKKTVNFDAPDVYHLYYGDAIGHPGTILTFFPFPDASRGRRGVGEVSAVAFQVPVDSLEYWAERLSAFGIQFNGPETRFGNHVFSFEDPDGMYVDLVFADAPSAYQHWSKNAVPEEFSIRRIHGATLQLHEKESTVRVMLDILGFRFSAQEGNRCRYVIGTRESEASIDILSTSSVPPAQQGAGSVHHIAWRTSDNAEQREWQSKVAGAGLHVTHILDRNYFRSIYFREPGGILFEIATDPPGFTVDEPVEELGSHLKLPSWLEVVRPRIEAALPRIAN